MNNTRDELELGTHRHSLSLSPNTRGALRRVIPQDGMSGMGSRISIKKLPRTLALSRLIR